MNPSSAFAEVFVDELVRGGMREAVLAPGSRSAPLALALVADQRIRLHVRHDERSAGYLALGLAKVSGQPVAVVCTSGTAVASVHPAVLEASHARVPLLALTADRPPELQQTGANQTTDQVRVFGSAPRWATQLGVPERRSGVVAYWRSVAARACAVATRPLDAGPVHVNMPLREPLVPDDDDGEWPEPLAGRPAGRPWIEVDQALPPVDVLGDPPERGAVLVGEGCQDPDAAVRLAQALAWPVLSEPSGDARTADVAIGTFPLLLADEEFAARHRPDLVVVAGAPGLSRSVLAWLRAAGEHLVVDPAPGFADPTRTATRVVPAVPVPGVRREPGHWLRAWQAADAAARQAVDTVLDETEELSEPRVARELFAELPDGALLFAGSSRPGRDLEAYAVPRTGVHVYGNRGLAGIDGSVSAAMGAAYAHQRAGGGQAYALLGDLALLHDVNGFAVPPGEQPPALTFVVVDNDGGGIFSLLEQQDVAGFERVFGTPHGLDLCAVLAAYRVPVTEVAKAADLRAALAPTPGITAVVVRTDRGDNAVLHRRVQAAVGDALGQLQSGA
ncbi:MAG: 2-succinyl-5-enolpyruvyl-6-hydroxy-3-cyclohexene-1-carboxylic-acid synthase [Streptosporangiales bacterium]|nr:2-succinyl-5-enolpyruvyl-6-hydroxy-3-cyclohexene-1-carboxylic-acid synthase [Streptosporangiales bacterium]